MATFGSINEFSDDEDWLQYTERLEHYFVANDIDDAKKKAILLSVCGSKTYSLIRNLTAPEKPGDKTYKEIVDIVKQHCNPQPSEIVQRYRFHTRRRKPTESVSEYVAELRKLSEFCNFGIILEDMLRDRLVCGINDDRIQRRMLAEPNLKFPKALELALAAETAAKNTADIQSASGSSMNNAQNAGEHQVSQREEISESWSTRRLFSLRW